MMKATGAEITVKLLERQGITVASGIPGGSILPIYDALYKSSIKHILTRHEQAAGFIAQGIARSTGLPAVCFATSGPGAINMLTAIADAKADSIPLVAITGQVATSFIGTDAFQEADTFGLSFPITKHSMLVSSAEELFTAIPEAFSIAASGRPGPVLIDIPVDIQQQKVSFEEWPEPGKKERKAARFRTEGKELAEKLDSFAETLLKAERPVIFAGGGCTSTSAMKGLAALLEVFPAPVVSSLMGLCSLPSSHPCWCGMTGIYGLDNANRTLRDADVILAAGVRFDERAAGKKAAYCAGKVLHIDIDAAEIDKLIESSDYAVTDTESALPVLAECIRRKKTGSRVAELSTEKLNSSNSTAEYGKGELLVKRLASAVSDAGLEPEDIVVVTDVGQHQMWTARAYPFSEPRQLLTSGSLGTMGFGLPAAIGAALAQPEKRVLLISGDGSIMMNLQELATLKELDCDVTIAVLDNKALGLVRQLQAEGFRRHYSQSAYKAPSDIGSIAEAFGISACRLNGEKLLADDDAGSEWKQFAFPKKGSGPRVLHIEISKDWK